MSVKLMLALFVITSVTIRCLHAEEAQIQSQGTVYMLAEIDENQRETGFYKVGKTKQNINKRISDLQGGNPRKIVCKTYANVNDMNGAETAAHRALQQWNTKARFGGGSEWFLVPGNDFNRFLNGFNDAVQQFRRERSFVELQKIIANLYKGYDY